MSGRPRDWNWTMSSVVFASFFLLFLPFAAGVTVAAAVGTWHLIGTPYWPAVFVSVPVALAFCSLTLLCCHGLYGATRDAIRGNV